MKWAIAATVLLLAGVGGLLLAGDRDGATQAATGNAQLQWKAQAEPDPRARSSRATASSRGRIRNASLRAVDLESERVQILDAAGHRLKATALFAQHFSHGLYPWSMHVKGSKFERRRTGKIATIKPGQAVPLTLSWRVGVRRRGARRGPLRRRPRCALPG